MLLTPRDATLADYPTFARLFLELAVPDPTPTAAEFEQRIRPHAFFLCDDAGRPVAYSFWLALGDVARVNHVVVDPLARGRGVGGVLFRELAARAKRARCARWMLYVKPDNEPAIRLYAHHGMRAVGRMHAMRIGWNDVARLPLDEETEAFAVLPEDDARVEAATGLPSGQIEARRAGGGFVLVALRRGADVVAFAAYDPSFPGAMPFVAPTAGLTRALLEAMRPHARAERSYVRFVAHADDVARAVHAAGGETMLELLEMKGAIEDA